MLLQVIPRYCVRFEILHKWWEKYDPRKIIDQKTYCSKGFTGDMLNPASCIFDYEFHFDYSDFVELYESMRDEIIRN